MEQPNETAIVPEDTNKIYGLTNEQVVSLLTYLETKPFNEVIGFMRMLHQAPRFNVIDKSGIGA